MVRPRPDAPLLSHLADLWGEPAVRAYQSLPYLLLPGYDFLRHLLERQDYVHEHIPTLDHIPWPDFMLDLGPVLQGLAVMLEHEGFDERDMGTAQVWTRAVRGDVFNARRDQSAPYLEHIQPECLMPPRNGRWATSTATQELVLEHWTGRRVRRGSLGQHPTVCFVPREEPWEPDGYGFYFEVPTTRISEEAMRGVAVINLLALLSLAYLCQSPEYYVEVQPVLSAREQKLEEKAAKKRPELKRALSYFILLDPLRAHEYGCPTPQDRRVRSTETEEEEHIRKQRPHLRRGHWRVLRAARFGEHRGMVIPVRASWVGPQDWTSEGLRYRVTEPLAPGSTSHLGPVRRLPGADQPRLRPPTIAGSSFEQLVQRTERNAL